MLCLVRRYVTNKDQDTKPKPNDEPPTPASVRKVLAMLIEVNGQCEHDATITDESLITVNGKVAYFTAVRRLIETGWCVGGWAKDKVGRYVHYNDGGACCFCLGGAFNRIDHKYELDTVEMRPFIGNVYALLRNYCKHIGKRTFMVFSEFNDSPEISKEDVLGFLDFCIQHVKDGAI